MRSLNFLLVEGPRWTLLGVLVGTPWVYGATPPWARMDLTLALLALAAWFAVGMVITRRWPRIHWVAALLTCLLLVQGWGMVWNAKQRFWPEIFAFTTQPSPVSFLPGVVDPRTAQERLLLVTGLVGVFWIVCDLAADTRWRDRFWAAFALSGAGIAVLGLAQRLTGAGGIFWGPAVDSEITSFFATYRYHANAGAFMNLTLPFLVLKAVQAFDKRSFHLRNERERGFHQSFPQALAARWRQMPWLGRFFWPAATFLTVAAGFVNVSRGAMTVELVLLGVLLVSSLADSQAWGIGHRRRLTCGFLACGLMGGLIWAFGFEDSWRHWMAFFGNASANPRFLVDQVITQRMLGTAGWWGFGAGTFRIVFPFFTNPWGERLAGVWEYAHQDYLQTLVEWGYVGGALWSGIFGGGWVFAWIRRTRFSAAWSRSARRFSLGCLLSLGGVVLHAAVDFPLQIASLALYAAVVLGFLWSSPKATRRAKWCPEFGKASDFSNPR